MTKRIPEDRERGLRISELVEDGGWQVAHLAREVGVDRGRIYDWMNGAPMNSTSLAALAGVLNTTREFLLTGNGPLSPKPSATEAGESETQDLLRELVAGQQELTATALRVERLLRDRREQEQPGAQRRSGGG